MPDPELPEALIVIGYWRNDRDPDLPDPRLLVDPEWAEDEKDTLVTYLRRGVLYRAFMGFSTCRICGIQNGNLQYTDMKFAWPEGLAHYLEEHDVRLPSGITTDLLKRSDRISSVEGGLDVWRDSTGV